MVIASHEPYNMVFAKFYVPFNDDKVIHRFLKKLQSLRLIKGYKIYETHEELFGLGLNSKYIDVKEKSVRLPWNEWYEEISSLSSWNHNILPIDITKEPEYKVYVDKHDVMILEALEINAFKEYTEIGREINLSPSTVKHHYVKHLIGYGIILGYVPRATLFHPDMLKYLYAIIDFYDRKTMFSFINTLWNSPVMVRLAKVLGDDKIIATILVPRTDELKFLAFMERLVRDNIIYDYRLYPLVFKTLSSWTIPAEMFTERGWLSGWDIILKVIRRVLREEKKVYSGRRVR